MSSIDTVPRTSNMRAHLRSIGLGRSVDISSLNAGDSYRCEALRVQVLQFSQAINSICNELGLLAKEWELERNHDFSTVRVHRIRFDLTLRSFHSRTRDFRRTLQPGGVRRRLFSVVEECRKAVSKQLPLMSFEGDAIDWHRRLSDSIALVSEHLAVMQVLLRELEVLDSSKRESMTKFRESLTQALKEF